MWQQVKRWFWGEEPHNQQAELDFIAMDRAVICMSPTKEEQGVCNGCSPSCLYTVRRLWERGHPRRRARPITTGAGSQNLAAFLTAPEERLKH